MHNSLVITDEQHDKVYPLQKKTHTHEHLRAHTHLRARTDETAAVLRTRALLTRSLCEYFDVRLKL